MRKFQNNQGETTEVRTRYRVTYKTPYVDDVPGYDFTFDLDDEEAMRDYKDFFPDRHSTWYAATRDEARLQEGDYVELSFHKGNPFGENHPCEVWC